MAGSQNPTIPAALLCHQSIMAEKPTILADIYHCKEPKKCHVYQS